MWLVTVRIERCVVANVEFRIFADATGYITDVERHGRPFVSAGLLPPGFPADRAVLEAPWRRRVGAHPEGLASDVRARIGHPVVQLSWNDAAAYVAWAGERLPTEGKREYSTRGGLERCTSPVATSGSWAVSTG
ncbi:SUMF1/EgtB/PvdO family nonheme iron enzyme [Streptomyces virginiae]|uniref:SUMF1/EgtB/PvdO family nonheme iron enzyme n=1 Tax=Streptomyces virginiae TaxID=1961 RepID=UPI0032543F9B